MIKHTLHVLEFHKLLHILSGYASSTLGETDCLSLEPKNDLKVIDKEQRLVSEMKLLVQVKGFFPFEGLIDIEPILKKCRAEGSCLEPENLLCLFRTTKAGKDSKKAVLSQQEICPLLYDMIKDMPLCGEMREAIIKAIHSNGTIKDSASRELRRIRRKKRDLRRDLQQRLEDIKKSIGFTSDGKDHRISLRDGRYVIPLRTDRKNRVQGIIHDYSHTHATCFFEPIEVIQDNNRLAELIHLEREEELKILAGLTTIARDSAKDLLRVQALLGKLDGLFARAQFSTKLNGIRPIMNLEDVVDLRGAKNPILITMNRDGEPPVPVDIFLDGDVNVLIISGPNRGGKTVSLKTLGLLSLMAQSGIHIPADERSRLPVFKNILAEIGDDQDIQAGLSTFSAHVSHLRYMIENADQRSLIIIDEPGMGTDPDEGAALAMALLDELSAKGALVAVSTHYNRLKSYGLLDKRAKNASMEFDEATNRPMFTLKYGTPGTSYAFEMARDYGIRPDLIERAQGYLDQDEVRLNRLIDKLNRLRHETVIEKSEAEHTKKKYHAAREKILGAIKRLESDEKALLEEKRSEADLLINEAREEFKTLINSFKRKKQSDQTFIQQRYDEITRRVKDNLLIGKDEEKSVETDRLKAGQWVRHKSLGQEGRIISLDRSNSKAWIMAGNVRLSVDMHDLLAVPDKKSLNSNGPYKEIFPPISSAFSKEINLVGYRVEDALPLIDKMIDRTMMEGDVSLKIVHGYGTGRLKSAIRDHLEGFSCVKRISGADPKSGGEAVTLVELS